jgi:hypothetical protein
VLRLTDLEDFSHSATGASFSIEGEAGVPILRVFLQSRSGEDFARDVNLSERIGNNNGDFYYGKQSSLSTKVRELT